MTILNAVEQIKDVFPNLGYNQILLMLDDVQKKFAKEGRLLTEEGGLSDIRNNIAWVLPSDFAKIYDISFYDSENKPLNMHNLGLDFEIEFNKIYLKSITSVNLESVPNKVVSGFIHYYKKPATLELSSGAIPSGSLEVGEEYADYIISGVLAKGFSRYIVPLGQGTGLNLNAASYHEKRYKEGVRQAKRDDPDMIRDVVYYQHAGKHSLPQRNYSIGGTVALNTLQALSALWSKYVRIKITDGVATVLSPKVGYGTITADITGSVVTIESGGEFENDTWHDSNNKNYSITSYTSSAIEFTFGDPTGEFEIEIGDKYAS